MIVGPKFLISDDHALFRRGLRYTLLDNFDTATILEAATFDAAMEIIGSQPDLALASFDLRMPGMQSGRVIREVRQLRPNLPIVMLSGQEDRNTVLMALQMGASGFIPKSLSAESIVAAIHDVLAGRIFIPSTIIDVDRHQEDDATPLRLVDDRKTVQPEGSAFDLSQVTPRQREVLEHLLTGRSSKQIGRDLDLAEGTIKIHLSALFRLLGVRNRSEAVTKAAALGLFKPPSGDRSV